VIFPPYISKSTAKALDVIAKGEDDEAVNYFVDHLPRLKKKDPDCEMRLFIQYPGDTVFIPGGWWHAVLNIDDTIAITQVSKHIFCHI
jgi:histone arginine demethylase JMJD6